MADTTMRTPFPPAQFPLVDQNGLITQVWRQFLTNIFGRTGGTTGVDLSTITALVDALQLDVQTFDGTAEALVPAPLRFPDAIDTPIPAHGVQYQDDLHALASSSANGFMAATDKVRLDAMVSPMAVPQALTTDVTAANIATDVTILTETIAAAMTTAGRQRRFSGYALVSNGTTAGTLQVWLKVGTTKVFTLAFTTPVTASTNRGVYIAMDWCWRAVGASGTLQVGGTLFTNSTATPTITPDTLTAPATVDTTVSQTYSVGFNWTAANAANTVTAKTASLTEVV